MFITVVLRLVSFMIRERGRQRYKLLVWRAAWMLSFIFPAVLLSVILWFVFVGAVFGGVWVSFCFLA